MNKWPASALVRTPAPPMQATHCPLCYEPLEAREVGPCMVCGSIPGETEHARSGRHTFAEYRVFGELSLVLCNYCECDFSSFDPGFFGLARGKRVGPLESKDWRFVRDIPPAIVQDKCCPNCLYRLPFLEFVVRARELHGQWRGAE